MRSMACPSHLHPTQHPNRAISAWCDRHKGTVCTYVYTPAPAADGKFHVLTKPFSVAKCFLVHLSALSLYVLGPESPAAATAMTCDDESSKRGSQLEIAAAGYILVHVFCRRSPKTLQNLSFLPRLSPPPPPSPSQPCLAAAVQCSCA